MSNEIYYPNVDPILVEVIKSIPQMSQVQYATKDQLKFLIDVGHKLGLYDACDFIKRITQQ